MKWWKSSVWWLVALIVGLSSVVLCVATPGLVASPPEGTPRPVRATPPPPPAELVLIFEPRFAGRRLEGTVEVRGEDGQLVDGVEGRALWRGEWPLLADGPGRLRLAVPLPSDAGRFWLEIEVRAPASGQVTRAAYWVDAAAQTVQPAGHISTRISPAGVAASGAGGQPGQGWVQANGPYGGNVAALAVNPQVSGTVYAGTYGAGIFRATDGGADWQARNGGLYYYYRSAYALAVDPLTPSILYASLNGSVYKTFDGGEQWWWASNGLGSSITDVAVDPVTPDTVYAAGRYGVYKTTIGGFGWNRTVLSITAEALAVDPISPSVVYAGTSQGLYKSTDGGDRWTRTVSCTVSSVAGGSDPLPQVSATGGPGYPACIPFVAASPVTSGVVYAGWYSPTQVSKSTDGGATWATVLTTSAQLSALAVHPTAGDTLYVGTQDGLHESTDGGESWESPALPGNQAVNAVAVDRVSGDVYVGTKGGVCRSADGGVTWSEVNHGLNATAVRAIVTNPLDPRTMYASALYQGVYKSTDGGVNWIRATDGLTSEVNTLVAAPLSPTVLYAATDVGVYKSTDAAGSWSLLPGSPTVTVMAANPLTPTTLFAASSGSFATSSGGKVYRTTDGGESWMVMTDTVGAIATIAIDPHTPSTVYIGGSRQFSFVSAAKGPEHTGSTPTPTPSPPVWKKPTVYKSTDGGVTWAVSDNGLLDIDWDAVWSLVVDPDTPTTLYANMQYDLYKSVDGGAHWTRIKNVFGRLVLVDGSYPTFLYSGGYGSGVYQSTDGGVTWSSLGCPGGAWDSGGCADGGTVQGSPACSGATRDSVDYPIETGGGGGACDYVGALALNQTFPRVLYAGTGEWSGYYGTSGLWYYELPPYDAVRRGLNVASVRDYPGVGSSQSTALARAQTAGVEYVLHPVKWADLEPVQGQYNWDGPGEQSILHDVLDQATTAGVRVVLRIYRAPDWARATGTETAPPGDNQYLRDFMQALAAEFGTHFEGYVVWNEPNLPDEWGGDTPNAADYVALLRAAYEGAKAGDPNVTIVSAGLAPTQGGDGAVNDLTFLGQMYDAGLRRACDVVGMNGLGFAYAPDDTSDSNDLNFSRLARLRQVMVDEGDSATEAWALEVGWLRDGGVDLGSYNAMKVPSEKQGPYLLGAFLKARRDWPWLRGLFVWNADYDLWSSTTDHKHWFATDDWSLYLLKQAGSTTPRRPRFTSPCGTTNQQRPVFRGVASGAVSVTLVISATAMYTATTGADFTFAVTPTTDFDPGPHGIAAKGHGYFGTESLSSASLRLTISPSLPFDPLGVVFTYRHPGSGWTGVRVPEDTTGCVDPDAWRVSLVPGVPHTVTVPVSCTVSAQVTVTYGSQLVSLADGGGLYRGVFTPTTSDAGSFSIVVNCGGAETTGTGTALVDPDGVVYDARLGTSYPIQGATITCHRRDEDGNWPVWDAWNYPYDGVPQVNPQTTGADGYYSFVVPPGTYRLEASHPDYFPYASDDVVVVDEPVRLNVPLSMHKMYLPVILKGYAP